MAMPDTTSQPDLIRRMIEQGVGAIYARHLLAKWRFGYRQRRAPGRADYTEDPRLAEGEDWRWDRGRPVYTERGAARVMAMIGARHAAASEKTSEHGP